jgi:hypothetical protein
VRKQFLLMERAHHLNPLEAALHQHFQQLAPDAARANR